jgi:hypothetical protein
MHDHPKGAGDGPTTLTMDELVREMTRGGTRDFSEFDAIQRGVREHSELTGGTV